MYRKTPDGKTIPLATQKEYAAAGYLRSLNARGKVTRDSLSSELFLMEIMYVVMVQLERASRILHYGLL